MPTELHDLLIVMAKQPIPGKTKTRLMPLLNADDASRIYECFLRDKVLQMRSAADLSVSPMQLAVAYWPDTAESYFERLAPGFALFPQQGDSLSARLDSIFNLAFSTGWERVMAIDGDTPTLPTGFLSAGFEALDDPGVDVVLGPTEDGGYYAIGMRKPHLTLFDVIMSTPHVLKDTLARAQEVRLKTALLPEWHDVDEADDLYRLATEIASDVHATATRDFLRTFQLERRETNA